MVKSIYFTIIVLLISVNIAYAQNNCFMQLKYLLNQDIKNNSGKDNNITISHKNMRDYEQKQNSITAITANNKDRSLTITGIPSVYIKIKQIDNTIVLELPNSYFSKQINNVNYNWTAKLHSQIPELSSAKIIENKKNYNIVAFLNFIKPQEVKVTRVNTAQLSLYFISKQNNKLVQTISTPAKNNLAGTINKTSNLVEFIPKINDKTVPTKRSFISDSTLNTSPEGSKKITSPDLSNNKLNSDINQSQNNTLSRKPSNITTNNNDYKAPITDVPKIDLSLIPQNYRHSENEFTDTPNQLSELDRLNSVKNPIIRLNDYDDLLKIATSLEFEENLSGSIHQYSQAIIADSTRYEAYSGIGDIYYKQKDYNLAIVNYEKSLNINKNQVKLLLNLARCYTQVNDNLKALDRYKEVLKIQPSNYESNYETASLNFKLSNYDEAIKYYINCINASSGNLTNIDKARLHYNLANSYKAQNEIQKAIDDYKISIDLFKEFADSHFNLAAAYIQTNDTDLAIEELNRFIIYSSSQDDITEAKSIISKLYKSK